MSQATSTFHNEVDLTSHPLSFCLSHSDKVTSSELFFFNFSFIIYKSVLLLVQIQMTKGCSVIFGNVQCFKVVFPQPGGLVHTAVISIHVRKLESWDCLAALQLSESRFLTIVYTV